MSEVYSYVSAADFLRDAFFKKKKQNPAFSLRAWAKKIGLAGNASLSLMLAGKRPIPRKYLPVFVQDLELSSRESQFLELLVDCAGAKSPASRLYYLEKLKKLQPKNTLGFHELESFKALGNPLHFALLEMTELRGFKLDIAWIRKRLRIVVSTEEVREALRRLELLGLLERDAKRGVKKTHRHITNRADIADAGSQAYHSKISQLAAEQIYQQRVEEREFNSYSINICLDKITPAKEAIRQFVKDFSERFEAKPCTGDETYQLNVHFFGLTKESS